MRLMVIAECDCPMTATIVVTQPPRIRAMTRAMIRVSMPSDDAALRHNIDACIHVRSLDNTSPALMAAALALITVELRAPRKLPNVVAIQNAKRHLRCRPV
jgi:hypothetical protein